MSATHDRQRDPGSVRAYMHFNDRGLLILELRECARNQCSGKRKPS
jgi:hypothetical protein